MLLCRESVPGRRDPEGQARELITVGFTRTLSGGMITILVWFWCIAPTWAADQERPSLRSISPRSLPGPRELRRVVNRPSVRETLSDQGLDPLRFQERLLQLRERLKKRQFERLWGHLLPHLESAEAKPALDPPPMAARLVPSLGDFLLTVIFLPLDLLLFLLGFF